MSSFHAEKFEGGWLVNIGSDDDNKTKIVVKDNEMVKQFKEFVEQSKTQVLNEG